MSKQQLEDALKRQLCANRKIFVPYIMAGDGGLECLAERIHFLKECGATAIELGIPFSDPVADGPTIQAAGKRALNNGTTLNKVLTTLQNMKESRAIPIILMTYLNPIYAYGIDKFAEDCNDAGVAGVIIPDLPLEEENLVLNHLQNYGIAFIRLAALTSSKKRLKEIAQRTEGFLYAVSVTGTTGSRSTHQNNVKDYLNQLKKMTDVPVLAGFGVSNPQQAQELGSACDGVIVGSKIVDLFHQGKTTEIKSLLQESINTAVF